MAVPGFNQFPVRVSVFTRTAVAWKNFGTMNWNGKKVLVTGADGFIGSHLTERFVESGADVTALALYNAFDSTGWLDEIPQTQRGALRIERGDIRDAPQMMELCAGQHVVFHLAALIGIPYSYRATNSYVDTNVQGTINVMNGALAGGVERFIHTSTSEVYGTARVTPITEDHPLQGQSPYAASKIGADMMVESFHRSFGLPAVTLRPFNTFGPRQSERAVIGTVIRQALDPTCAEIRVGNLDPKRDFNFVGDTVDAFLAVATLDKNHFGQVFNAGSGSMVRIGEVVDLIVKATACGKPVVPETERHRPDDSEVMALVADSTRLHEASGWTPRVALEQGLEKTVTWWRDRAYGRRPSASYIV